MAKLPVILIGDYKIMAAPDPRGLAAVVNEQIAAGWQPLGGVSCSLSESHEYRYVTYTQAMIRIDKEGW